MLQMSFDVHPILEPGQRPAQGVWYAISVEGGQPASKDAETTVSGPSPRVGSNANYFQDGGQVGKVLITGGATPDGPFSEVHQLSMRKGEDLEICLFVNCGGDRGCI